MRFRNTLTGSKLVVSMSREPTVMYICVCTSYYCELVVGLRTQFLHCRVVGGLGIRMMTLDTKTSLYIFSKYRWSWIMIT